MSERTVLRNGTVYDGTGGEGRDADVVIADGRVEELVQRGAPTVGREVDCAGRLVLPGMIDAHSHADGAVFDPEVRLVLLRQGVTTVIAGQDGVSYAPGNGDYGSEYFGGLNGPHPTYSGGGVRALLDSYAGLDVRVDYLVPQGTVRFEVLGRSDAPATATQLAAMQDMVATGLAEGAVGVSSGLDYVPGRFADAAELAAICAPAADAGVPYVTHMRGYEMNLAIGVAEVIDIGRTAGVAVHISHLHAPADAIVEQLALAEASGVDVTYDAYPYRAAFSLLSMPLLPPELLTEDPTVVAARLTDTDLRETLLRGWFPERPAESLGTGWEDRIRIADAGGGRLAWTAGLDLATAARQAGTGPHELALDILAESRLAATTVMPVPMARPVSELVRNLTHPLAMGGSDGIFLGAAPHPRGWGTFARYLRLLTVERGVQTWAEAARRYAAVPAGRFGLHGRGVLRPGAEADVIVVDPSRVRDTATYEKPRSLAEGIDDVWVGGRHVLTDGRLTG